MKYRLTVIKYEDNENYEKEMAEWKEGLTANAIWNRRYDEPSMDKPRIENPVRVLEVELTNEEYIDLKKRSLNLFN